MCIPYLDDIIDFNGTFEDHNEHLRKVLTNLRQHGAKLKPKRCNLFKREVTFLGRIVSADGHKLDPVSTEPVQNLMSTTPQTVGDVRKLTGLLSYYLRYIKDVSRVAKTLYELLCSKSKKKEVTSHKAKLKMKGNFRSQGQSPSNQQIS